MPRVGSIQNFKSFACILFCMQSVSPGHRSRVSVSGPIESIGNMRSVFAIVVLVAVANALTFQSRSRDKKIQRLAHDEPIPDGWRLATVDDAQRNPACFRLVLRPRTFLRKRDKALMARDLMVSASNSGDPFASSPIRIEKKPPLEQCTCKVVVHFNTSSTYSQLLFNEYELLKRERVERAVSGVCKLCEYYILTYCTISIIPSFAFKGVFFYIFLFVIYVYMPNVIRTEWIQRRGSI